MDGKVLVPLVKNCSKEKLMPYYSGENPGGINHYTDGWKAYDGLILNGHEHFRVYHSKNEFASQESKKIGFNKNVKSYQSKFIPTCNV